MDKGKVIALEFLYSGGKHNLLKFLGKSVLLMSRFLPACWYIKINNMISGFSGDTMCPTQTTGPTLALNLSSSLQFSVYTL